MYFAPRFLYSVSLVDARTRDSSLKQTRIYSSALTYSCMVIASRLILFLNQKAGTNCYTFSKRIFSKSQNKLKIFFVAFSANSVFFTVMKTCTVIGVVSYSCLLIQNLFAILHSSSQIISCLLIHYLIIQYLSQIISCLLIHYLIILIIDHKLFADTLSDNTYPVPSMLCCFLIQYLSCLHNYKLFSYIQSVFDIKSCLLIHKFFPIQYHQL